MRKNNLIYTKIILNDKYNVMMIFGPQGGPLTIDF